MKFESNFWIGFNMLASINVFLLCTYYIPATSFQYFSIAFPLIAILYGIILGITLSEVIHEYAAEV